MYAFVQQTKKTELNTFQKYKRNRHREVDMNTFSFKVKEPATLHKVFVVTG